MITSLKTLINHLVGWEFASFVFEESTSTPEKEKSLGLKLTPNCVDQNSTVHL